MNLSPKPGAMVDAPLVKRVLYALPSDFNSRFIRLLLGELGLPFALKNPGGDGLQDIPAFQDENGALITYATCIAEYLDEAYGAPFIGQDPVGRAQVRQVWRYIEGPVADRVTSPLIYERVHRRMSGLGTPDSGVIQRANVAKGYYFKELERLSDLETWIAGPFLTLADLSLAAQLSLLDYLDLIDWGTYPILADYYRRLKSRPSMRPVLLDRLEGINPSNHYSNLDF